MKRVFAFALSAFMVASSLAGCAGKPGAGASSAAGSNASTAGAKTYAMIGRATGNPYVTCELDGFKSAVGEIGGKAVTEAPDTATAEAEIPMVNQLTAQGVAAIAIASNDANALQPVLQNAISKNVKILSYDSPASPASRALHINQADPEQIGRAEVQALGQMINYTGQIAILSATSTSDNQNTWIGFMKEELKDPKYKNMKLVKIAYGDDQPDKSTSETQALLQTYPNLKGIIAPTTVGIESAGKVLTDKKLAGKVALTGLGLPSQMATYIKNGVCPWMFLWNPVDLGYLAAYTSKALDDGTITGKIGDSFTAGKLGKFSVTKASDGGTQVLLGPPFKFDKSNIDQWQSKF